MGAPSRSEAGPPSPHRASCDLLAPHRGPHGPAAGHRRDDSIHHRAHGAPPSSTTTVPERMGWMYPAREWQKAGVHLAMGTDLVTNVQTHIYHAVTRTMENGEVANSDQCIETPGRLARLHHRCGLCPAGGGQSRIHRARQIRGSGDPPGGPAPDRQGEAERPSRYRPPFWRGNRPTTRRASWTVGDERPAQSDAQLERGPNTPSSAGPSPP